MSDVSLRPARAADAEELARVAAAVGSDVPLFLEGTPALIEGRGEIVTPLAPWLGEPPGLLLITAGLPLRTPDVFAAFAAGARDASHGAALVSSQHLAAELAGGLSGAQLLDRAAALASANDLRAPARATAPWLRPFEHALRRLLERPLALSGSGPTLFLLYPSQREAEAGAALVETALANGELAAPEGLVRLSIGDNGRGFPVDGHRGPGHQGLVNMRGRAVGMGGDLAIESAKIR